MSHVHIHRHTPTKANPYILAMVFWDSTNSGTWSRVFRTKGIHPYPIGRRPMSARELDVHQRAFRLGWLSYNAWEGLIANEWDETQDRAWCEELRELSHLRKQLDDMIKTVAEKPAVQAELFTEQSTSPY